MNLLTATPPQATTQRLGMSRFYSNTTGTSNNAVGYGALGASNTTANQNNAFGRNSLGSNTTGADNTGFGQNTLLVQVTTGIGTRWSRLMYYNTTGRENTLLWK